MKRVKAACILQTLVFFREMISEQTACVRQSAANAHCTGCTPVIPWVYLYFNEFQNEFQTSVYKGYKQDKIEMRGDRAEMSDFPLYLNTVAGGLDRRDQTIGGFSFVVKIYAVPVIEIIG